MAFCTKCGQQLAEGTPHDCEHEQAAAAEAAPIVPTGMPVPATQPSAAAIDPKRLVGLLKNPYSALQLSPDRDLVYGLVGLAASAAGFFIWAWALQAKIINSVLGMFSGLVGFSGGLGSDSSLYAAPKFLLLGILSLAALLAALTAIGSWQGSSRQPIKDVLVKIGGIQLIGGAGFVLAAVLLLFSIQISLLAVVCALALSLIVTFSASEQLFRVPGDKRFMFQAVALALYLVLLLVLTVLIL